MGRRASGPRITAQLEGLPTATSLTGAPSGNQLDRPCSRAIPSSLRYRVRRLLSFTSSVSVQEGAWCTGVVHGEIGRSGATPPHLRHPIAWRSEGEHQFFRPVRADIFRRKEIQNRFAEETRQPLKLLNRGPVGSRLRSRILRSGDPGARTTRKPVRPKGVTYVSGTFCNLCLRAGPREEMVGARGFEPPTPWSRTRCSTRLSHAPTAGCSDVSQGGKEKPEQSFQSSTARTLRLGSR
jgi:hypothetical protein